MVERTKTTHKMSLVIEDIHPVRPQFLNVFWNQSSLSSLIEWTISFILLMEAWILWLLSDRLKQQNPSNFSQLCPCTKRRKSMAAWFCRVACLVASSSSRSLLRAADIKFTCFATQHSWWLNWLRAFAAATRSKKAEMAALFGRHQCTISESQCSSKSLILHFWMAELLDSDCQFKIWVWFGENRDSCPMVQRPPKRQAQALSPQIKKVPFGSLSGCWFSLDGMFKWVMVLHHLAAWNSFLRTLTEI